MARLKAESAINHSEALIETLKCYLRESEIILRALEEQKTTVRETLLHEKRLGEARREHLQLQNELTLASERHERLSRKKTVMQPA